MNGRFGHKDLASILNAHPPTTTRQAGESRSLAQGTRGWAPISQPQVSQPQVSQPQVSQPVDGPAVTE
ncbi:hypothetical protein [uncultured Friedmanniella sp.]|uniref:hypothetical protein n=1 Tax=uncultured Friedmanniella sp. TaxID=335381 RepID=UPI0035CA0ED5